MMGNEMVVNLVGLKVALKGCLKVATKVPWLVAVMGLKKVGRTGALMVD